MDDCRKDVLNAAIQFLHNDLKVGPTFLDMLLQYGVLTDETKEQLQEEKPSRARSELINLLKKCSNEQYDACLHVLRTPEVGQGHIADKLEATERIYKDKSLTEKVKGKIQVFIQKHYMNGRHFTPMEANIITKSLVLEEDYMEQLIQNEMNITNNRKLKQEVLTTGEKMQKLSKSHSDEMRKLRTRLRDTESQLNQYKTQLEASARKCTQLQERLVQLEHPSDPPDRASPRSPAGSRAGDRHSSGYPSSRSPGTTDNRYVETRSELNRTKNELNQMRKKFDQQQRSVESLNHEVGRCLGAETAVKEVGDPLRSLERKVRALQGSLTDTHMKVSPARVRDMSGAAGDVSVGVELSDRLRRKNREADGLRRKLKDVQAKLREAEQVLERYSNSSDSSGSRRPSLAPPDAWSRRGSTCMEQYDGGGPGEGGRGERLPVLPATRRSQTGRPQEPPAYTVSRTISAPGGARHALITPPTITLDVPVPSPPPLAARGPATPVVRPRVFEMGLPTEQGTACRGRHAVLPSGQRPFPRDAKP